MLYQWIISLPMMVCLFWAVFFTVRFHRGNDEPRIVGTIQLFYVATTILYTDHWLYFSECPSFIGEWSYSVVNLCVYPLYYAYLRAITRTRIDFEVALLLLPAVLMAVIFPLNMRYLWGLNDSIRLVARICFAAQVVWVLIRGYRLIRDTRRHMDNTYSDDRSHLLQPIHILLLLFAITAVVSMTLNFFGREFFTDSILVDITAILMSILLYGLGYVAAHTTLPQETVAHEEPQEDRATTEETDALMSKIAKVLREQKIFTDPHLTIQDLAAAVGSNRTYVSNCINRRTGLSFSQYVARYRVEHAQTILRDPQYTSDHEAITEAIALSGFSSDQTFYRVFKDITGLTPLQYRQQNLQK